MAQRLRRIQSGPAIDEYLEEVLDKEKIESSYS